MACLSFYALWAKNDFHNYFDSVDSPVKPNKPGKTQQRTDGLTIISPEDLTKDQSKNEGKTLEKSEIE